MSRTAGSPWRWRGRSSPDRFELVTRLSVQSVYLLEPFLIGMLLLAGGPGGGPWPLVLLALVLAHAGTAVWAFGPALRAAAGRAEPPYRAVGLVLVLTAAIWVVGVLGYPGAGSGAVGLTLLVSAAGALGVVVPLLPRMRWVLVAGALPVVLITALLQVYGADRAEVISTAVGGLLALVGCALSFRLSVWTMRVVWELDEARAVAGRLAVAEERLRFSRDLHDVFGRTLSTVAVKSELAAALADQGDPRGSAEMLQVRQLAHDALREVRGVVQGYRAVDLATEIAGARELLRSAGVECRVAGEGLTLPEPVAEAVAWVVRESVTNVVRHAAATQASIDVRLEPDVCRVTITNDGVRADRTATSPGSGLAGLRERLDARGGTLVAEARGAVFVVEATIPLQPTTTTPLATTPTDAPVPAEGIS